MRALRVLGIAENGTQVVCQPVSEVTDTEAAASVRVAETFALPIDERLRAAVRGDISRIGQLEIEMESQLRPREIQQRIRAGSTIEQVAAAAGCSPERIERYAYPVLLERSTIAERARLAHPVIDGSSAARTVEEVVAQTLGARGQQSAVSWDAFRDERGWALRASWRAGRSENRATWTYHPGPAGGTVLARDESATMLVDPARRPLRTVGPDPAPGGASAGRKAPMSPVRDDTSATRTTAVDTPGVDPVAEAPAGPAASDPSGSSGRIEDTPVDRAAAVDDGGSPASLDGSLERAPDGSLESSLEGDSLEGAPDGSLDRAPDDVPDDDARDEQRRLVADTVSDARSGSRSGAGRRAESRPASTRAAADAVLRAGEIGVRGRDTGTDGPTAPAAANGPTGNGTPGAGSSGSGSARGKRGQRPAMPSWEDVLLGTRTGR